MLSDARLWALDMGVAQLYPSRLFRRENQRTGTRPLMAPDEPLGTIGSATNSSPLFGERLRNNRRLWVGFRKLVGHMMMIRRSPPTRQLRGLLAQALDM